MGRSSLSRYQREVRGGSRIKVPLQFITNNWEKILWFVGATGGAVYGAGRMIAQHKAVHDREDQRFMEMNDKLNNLHSEHKERSHHCPMGFPERLSDTLDKLREEMATTRNLLCNLQGTLETLKQLIPELVRMKNGYTRNSG